MPDIILSTPDQHYLVVCQEDVIDPIVHKASTQRKWAGQPPGTGTQDHPNGILIGRVNTSCHPLDSLGRRDRPPQHIVEVLALGLVELLRHDGGLDLGDLHIVPWTSPK